MKKKFWIVLIVTMFVMSIVRPVEALAMNRTRDTDREAEIICRQFTRVINNSSEDLAERKLTVVDSRVVWFEELETYEVTIWAYDWEMHEVIEDTVRIAPEDLDYYFVWLSVY